MTPYAGQNVVLWFNVHQDGAARPTTPGCTWTTCRSPSSQPTAPAAPTGVTATAGNGSATVSWTAPSSNGGSAITSYTVTPFIGSTAQTPVTVTGSPPATSTTVTGLTNGTSYTFTVSATNAIGTGPASVAVQRGDPERADGAGAPTGVTATAGNGVGDGELDRADQQWRQHDHQLHGDAVHRLDRADAGDGDRQPAGHLGHGDRADQRHQLHLHRVGDQRQRHRAGLVAVQRRDPERADGAGGADRGDGDRG